MEIEVVKATPQRYPLLETIVQLFLKAKHWQIFTAVCFFGLLSIYMDHPVNPHWGGLFVNIIVLLIYLGWIWSIASECNKHLSPELQKSPKFMLFGLTIVAAYIITSNIIVVLYGMETLYEWFSYPFDLAVMCCFFYSVGYTSKRLVTLQDPEKADNILCIGPYFMIWFFPMGVWFIQPKVNKLLGYKDILLQPKVPDSE